MAKKSRIFQSILLLGAASLACVQSANVPTLDPNAASTAIAETILAIEALASPTASPAASPTIGTTTTVTETSTVTPLPLLIGGISETPSVVTISVSVDTFCRLGPGQEYEKAGILLVGETAEVVGRDAFGQFWYIRNPDIGATYCWISGQYATLNGNVLSIFAQPPPANLSGGVDITYGGMGNCSNRWWSNLRLKNQSDSAFKSYSIVMADGVTDTVRSATSDGFTFVDDCDSPTFANTLNPGSTLMISSPTFGYDLTGAEATATLTLCTDANMRGSCFSKTVTFTPF